MNATCSGKPPQCSCAQSKAKWRWEGWLWVPEHKPIRTATLLTRDNREGGSGGANAKANLRFCWARKRSICMVVPRASSTAYQGSELPPGLSPLTKEEAKRKKERIRPKSIRANNHEMHHEYHGLTFANRIFEKKHLQTETPNAF